MSEEVEIRGRRLGMKMMKGIIVMGFCPLKDWIIRYMFFVERGLGLIKHCTIVRMSYGSITPQSELSNCTP